jgi:hypothetical protein
MKLYGAGKMGQKGIALTIAILMIICSSILAGYALQAGWNMRRIQVSSGSKRDRTYWYAKAGVVNARWRIRTNVGGQFTNPAFDPAAYTLDVNGDAVNDVSVDIGPVVNGLRQIDSTGLDQ